MRDLHTIKKPKSFPQEIYYYLIVGHLGIANLGTTAKDKFITEEGGKGEGGQIKGINCIEYDSKTLRFSFKCTL